jgi:hypothetical protein
MDEITIATIARICHQANKAYCESIGDYSQKDWENTNDDIHKSAMNGVRFRWENPNLSPKDQHENWKQDKIKEGWTYGPIKDTSALKKHPCIVSYDELPEAQRIKDRIFMGVVDAFWFKGKGKVDE